MDEIQDFIDVKEFGKRCAIVRKAIGLTQTEMAKQLGTTQFMIHKIESGERVMSTLLLRVLSFYSRSVSLDKMFGKNFKGSEDDLLNKQYALNTVVKAKIEILKEELLDSIDRNRKEIARQLDEASELL